MEPVVLACDELELSVPTTQDVPAMTQACQDADIAAYTTLPFPYRSEDAQRYVEQAVPKTWADGGGVWGIRRDGELTGLIGIHPHSSKVAEIGYWMDAKYRGNGLLSRAVPKALDFAFEAGFHRVEWRAAVGNWASWRPVWKQGFQFEGTCRQAFEDYRDASAPSRDQWIASLLSTDPRTPAAPWRGPQDGMPALPDPSRPADLVRQFHETYDVPIVQTGADVDVANLGMRMALIAEEFAELVGAVYGDAAEGVTLQGYGDAVAYDEDRRDTVAAADALADLVYVIYGMALETGIPLPEVLGEVHRSNLSKLDTDGSVLRREDGKVLKGPGFKEPKIAQVLQEHTIA